MLKPSPTIPDDLWTVLDGGLWHATAPACLESIVRAGAIIPRVGSRYQGGFTYSIGAISLFDLGPTATPLSSQIDNLVAWIGGQQTGASAVWIEITREKLDPQCFFDAGAARARFNEIGIGTNFIAGFEAYHLGNLSTDATGRLVMIARFDRGVFRVAEGMTSAVLEAAMTFEAAAPLPSPGTLARMHYDRINRTKSHS